MMPFPLLGQIAIYSAWLPILAGAYFYRTINASGRIFYFYTVYCSLIILIAAHLATSGISNLLFSKVVDQIETLYFLIVIRRLVKVTLFRRLAVITILVFIVISMLNRFIVNTDSMFETVNLFLYGIIHILFGGIMVYVSTNIFGVHYGKNPLFWIGNAMLLYYGGTLLIFSFGNVLYNSGIQLFNAAWHFNWALTVISNLLLSSTFILFHDE